MDCMLLVANLARSQLNVPARMAVWRTAAQEIQNAPHLPRHLPQFLAALQIELPAHLEVGNGRLQRPEPVLEPHVGLHLVFQLPGQLLAAQLVQQLTGDGVPHLLSDALHFCHSLAASSPRSPPDFPSHAPEILCAGMFF